MPSCRQTRCHTRPHNLDDGPSSASSDVEVLSPSSLIMREKYLKFGLLASAGGASVGAPCGVREDAGRTEELERGALAGDDLGAGLAHARERDGDLLGPGARDAVGEDVDVVAVLEEIERGLLDADVGLRAWGRISFPSSRRAPAGGRGYICMWPARRAPRSRRAQLT